jgi:hypothetical protein
MSNEYVPNFFTIKKSGAHLLFINGINHVFFFRFLPCFFRATRACPTIIKLMTMRNPVLSMRISIVEQLLPLHFLMVLIGAWMTYPPQIREALQRQQVETLTIILRIE